MKNSYGIKKIDIKKDAFENMNTSEGC